MAPQMRAEYDFTNAVRGKYRDRLMKPEYDFSKGKRGAVIPRESKTRISIFIDDAVLAEFRARAEEAGTGYQSMMNEALRIYLSQHGDPVTVTTRRRR